MGDQFGKKGTTWESKRIHLSIVLSFERESLVEDDDDASFFGGHMF